MTTQKSAHDDFIEIPQGIGKRHEPVIKGKGVPVWALVWYARHRNMKAKQISDIWDGFVTAQEVQAAISYAEENPELIDDRSDSMENGLGS